MNDTVANGPATDSAITPPDTSADVEDKAWASITIPLTETQLCEFCLDAERLLRINPLLEFDQWQRLGENRYQVSGRNLSQQPPFTFSYQLTVEQCTEECPKEIRFRYSEGLKSATTFRIEPDTQGSKLTIIDEYNGISQQERGQRLNEVDKSIINWAHDIQVYIFMWQRWSWLPLWPWYMRKVWQPMKPSARRIAYMLIWITVAEIALISLGFLIYWIEYR